MKTIPGGIDLTKPDLSLAVGCKLILKDGTAMGFTNHDLDVLEDVIDEVRYVARTGFFRNALSAQNKLSVPNMDIMGFLDSAAITEIDLRAGRYQDAKVQLFVYDWQHPEAGRVKLPGSGWLGSVKLQDPLGWTATLLGLMQAYQTNQGALYSADCRNDLADAFCTRDLASFTQSGIVVTVTNAHYAFTANAVGAPFVTTTQLAVPAWQANHRYLPGDAMLLPDDAIFFYVAVQTSSFANGDVPVSGKHAPAKATTEGQFITENDSAITWQATLHDWYFDGRLSWTAGNNTLYPGTIERYTVGTPATFRLQSPAPLAIVAGDTFTLEAGCGKQFYECRAKFQNQLNFNGENTAPGQEAFLDYPDQESQ